MTTGTDADMRRRRHLEDREEIRQIFVDYARYLDAGDHHAYASLFTSDGVLVAQLGQAVGPAEIEAILDETLGPHKTGHLPPAVHIMNNQRIDIDASGDTATSEVIWFYLTTDDDSAPTVLQAGRYTDDLVREDGRWKIARHDITRIMGRSPMNAPPPTRLDAIERRLRVLEAKEGIWELFMEYKKQLDLRHFATYSKLFTDDGVWVGNLGKATGPAEIEDLLVRTLEVYDNDQERTHHLVMNPVIEVGDDGTTAKALSNWGYVTRGPDDEPVFEMLGHYVDDLVLTGAGWRFSRREAYSDVPWISLEGII